MNKRVTHICRIILFSCLVIGMLSFVGWWLHFDGTNGGGGFNRFYRLPKKTVDVMAFGSSHAHCTVDHGLLWDKYGIAGFTFSAGSQKMDATAAFVKQAVTYKKPKVLLVEMFSACEQSVVNDDTTIGRNLIGMKWSPLYLEYAAKIIRTYPDITFDKAFEIMTKLPLIHSRYTEVTKEDMVEKQPYLMGYRGSTDIESFDTPNTDVWNERAALSADMIECLDEIVECAKKSNTGLVFWVAPYHLPQESQEYFNAVGDYAKEHEIPFIDFNHKYEELGIDFATDFRDDHHLNNAGAAKVTDYLGSYLKEHYSLEDHRGDDKYILWQDNSDYLQYKRDGKDILREKHELQDYLELLAGRETPHSVGILFEGYYNALPTYGYGMQALGVSQEQYDIGNALTIRNVEGTWVCSEEPSAGEVIEGSHNAFLTAQVGESEIEGKRFLHMDGLYYEIPENGLLIYEYDQRLNVMMDVVTVDVFNVGTEVIACHGIEE